MLNKQFFLFLRGVQGLKFFSCYFPLRSRVSYNKHTTATHRVRGAMFIVDEMKENNFHGNFSSLFPFLFLLSFA
jgi:hypothetical protein